MSHCRSQYWYDFDVVVVLLGLIVLESASLLLRAGAVGRMVVVIVVIVDVKEQNLPLPSSWGSSMLAGGGVVHAELSRL
jgi:hypothetical protein